MILYVLESSGSSPGRQGFFMCVNESGQMNGSIGGGMMEHKMVELARERLINNRDVISLKRQVHDKSALKDQSGMICSGEQTIVLYRVKETDKTGINQMISSLEEDRNGTLILSGNGIAFDEKIPSEFYRFQKSSEDNWLYEELTGYHDHAHIIGGGHCSLALSKLLKDLDFRVSVYDTRKDLNTLEQNIYAKDKIVLSDYSELKSAIDVNRSNFPVRNYIILMTFGYRTDDLALRSLQDTEFDYIGLLGSRQKINSMYKIYEEENTDMAWFEKIHRPIGIDINSHTPAEIAVSIAAELIYYRNR